MIPIETIWLPRPSAKYPGCYPLGFENKINELLGTNAYVHFFCGLAKNGYRIDINHICNPDLIANVESLPQIEDNSFKAGMADPPYTKEFAENLYACKYPKWSLWTKELVRIVQPRGKIAIMQNYVVPRLAGCEFEKILVIITRIKQYPKIVTIQRKL